MPGIDVTFFMKLRSKKCKIFTAAKRFMEFHIMAAHAEQAWILCQVFARTVLEFPYGCRKETEEFRKTLKEKRCLGLNSDRQAEKLARKAIQGNVKAYGQLIEYYKEYLYRTAWLLIKNQEDALDIVGDCILRGFHSIHTLKKPEYFRTWLTRILINSAKDYRKRYPETEDIDMICMAEPEKGISPEEKMDLYRALDLLPEKYRNVVILKYFDEMKISEIAYALEMPEGTVKVYLNRAKTRLRLLLEEDEIYEDEASGYTSSGRIGSGRTAKHEPYLFRAKA